MRSKSIASPAGTPSTIATSDGPCDSPAVKNLNIALAFYTKFLRTPGPRTRADGRFHCVLSAAMRLHYGGHAALRSVSAGTISHARSDERQHRASRTHP